MCLLISCSGLGRVIAFTPGFLDSDKIGFLSFFSFLHPGNGVGSLVYSTHADVLWLKLTYLFVHFNLKRAFAAHLNYYNLQNISSFRFYFRSSQDTLGGGPCPAGHGSEGLHYPQHIRG